MNFHRIRSLALSSNKMIKNKNRSVELTMREMNNEEIEDVHLSNIEKRSIQRVVNFHQFRNKGSICQYCYSLSISNELDEGE